MSPLEEEVSPASDFVEERKLITLPRKGSHGRELRLLIRAVPLPDLIAALDGIPGPDAGAAGPADAMSWSEVRKRLLEQQAPLQRVAALGIVMPHFTFEAREPGCPHWPDLHFENQSAVMAEVMKLSGMGGNQEAADADGASFPEVAGE